MLCEVVAQYNKFPSAPLELKKTFAENAWKLIDGFRAEYVDVNADNIHTLFCIWSMPYPYISRCREDLRQMFDARLDEACGEIGIQGDVHIVDTGRGDVAMFELQWVTEKVASRIIHLQQYGIRREGTRNGYVQMELI